jgi:hypothetical protein
MTLRFDAEVHEGDLQGRGRGTSVQVHTQREPPENNLGDGLMRKIELWRGAA